MSALLPQRPPALGTAIEIVAQGVLDARKTGRRPRLHPNGFIQLDLTKDGSVRFHVWPAVPIPAQKTRHTIHDHVFDMQSTILAGKMVNVLYKGVPLSEFQVHHALFPMFRMYRATRIAKDDTVLAPADENIYALTIAYRESCEPGETYFMQKGLLHDSVPEGLTCTLMYKLNPDAEYRPIVAVPTDTVPDNDFRRETTDEHELWRHIFIALEAAQAAAAQQFRREAA